MFLSLMIAEALAQLVSHIVPHFVIGMAVVAGRCCIHIAISHGFDTYCFYSFRCVWTLHVATGLHDRAF